MLRHTKKEFAALSCASRGTDRHGAQGAHDHARAARKGIARHDLALRLRGAQREGLFRAHAPPRISKDMVSLAAHILESKATKFDPGKFQDVYEKALRKLVQPKAKGHPLKPPSPRKGPAT